MATLLPAEDEAHRDGWASLLAGQRLLLRPWGLVHL